MRVGFDTNVVISATLYDRKPLMALNACLLTREVAVTSPELLAELSGILTRKFKVPQDVARELVDSYRKHCVVIAPVHTLSIMTDEPDNRVLECAVEGECSYIVTGDKDLLELGRYKTVQVVSVDDFLRIVEE